MNVIIIGASGIIGNAIYNKCLEKKINVCGTYFTNLSNKYIYFDLLNDTLLGLQFPQIDAKDKTYVIICSAISSIDQCYSNTELSRALNIEATEKLIKEANRLGYRTVFISSEAVFNGTAGFYEETQKVDPITEYGMQKAAVEEFLMNEQSSHLIFRVSRAISNKNYKNNILTEFYGSIAGGRVIECLRGQRFTPTYAEDIAEAVILSMEYELSGLFHISNSELFSRAELADYFGRLLGLSVHIIEKDYEEFAFKDKRHLNGGLNARKLSKLIPIKYTSVEKAILLYRNKNGI